MQDKRELFGWFINESCYPLLEETISLDALQALRKHYSFYSSETRSKVIELHLAQEISQEVKHELLSIIIPTLDSSEEEERIKVQNLIKHLLSDLSKNHRFFCWSSLKEVLNISQKQHKELDFILARALGALSTNDSKLLSKLIENLLTGESNQIQINRDALDEAICNGAGDIVVSLLLSMTDSYRDIPKQRCIPIFSLFKDRVFKNNKTKNKISNNETNILRISSLLSPESRRLLAEWFTPMEEEKPSNYLGILIILSDELPTVQEKVKQVINKLGEEANRIIGKIPFVPGYVEEYIQMTSNDKESRKTLVKDHSTKARNTASEEEIVQLVEKAKDSSKEVANASVKELMSFLGKQERPNIDDFLLILEKSNVPGVRGNCLDALNKLIENGVTDKHLVRLWENLSKRNRKSSLQETQKMGDLIARWIKVNQSISSDVSELTDQLVQFVAKNPNGRLAQALFNVFKAIARTQERIKICSKLIEWTRTILIIIDIKTINNGQSEVSQVLRLINDIEPEFLSMLVEKDCPNMKPKERPQNISAVVQAIIKCGGRQLLLLDTIQKSDWCPLNASALISKFQLKSR